MGICPGKQSCCKSYYKFALGKQPNLQLLPKTVLIVSGVFYSLHYVLSIAVVVLIAFSTL